MAQMNILTFIETQYPIKDRVRELLKDPRTRVENMDDLPYDKIGYDEDGKLCKLVEIDDTRDMPVYELISYTQEDINESGDKPLIDAYNAYMSLVDIEDVNIMDLMRSVQEHKKFIKKTEAQLDVLSVHKVE